jgi:hypothetical protein
VLSFPYPELTFDKKISRKSAKARKKSFAPLREIFCVTFLAAGGAQSG